MVYASWSKQFMRPIFQFVGQRAENFNKRPVYAVFPYTLDEKLSSSLLGNSIFVSKKASVEGPSSAVNFKFGCNWFSLSKQAS